MGIVFFVLWFLLIVCHFAGFQILLSIERARYRRNWEQDVKVVYGSRSPDEALFFSRQGYDRLLRSWLLTTPAWVKDSKLAHRLLWCWRLGHFAIAIPLGALLFPIILALFK